MTERLETQAEFARRLKVDRSAINYYRKTGKLTEEAFVQEGKRLLVRVETACRQLGQNLDMLQATVNGRADLSQAPPPVEPPPVAAPLPTPTPAAPEPRRVPDDGPEDSVKAKYEAQRLRKIQLENEEAERKRRANAGVYVRTEEVRRTVGAATGKLWRQVESDMAAWAEELAGELGADPRTVEIILRRLIRGTRERVAQTAAELRDSFAEIDEDDAPDDADDDADEVEEATPAAAE